MKHVDVGLSKRLDQAQISAGVRSADLLYTLSCIFGQRAHLSIHNQRGEHEVLVRCHLNGTDRFLSGHWDGDGQKVQCTIIVQIANVDERSVVVVFQEALDADVVFLSYASVNHNVCCACCDRLLTVVSKISMSRFNKSRGNLYCLAEIQAYRSFVSSAYRISMCGCAYSNERCMKRCQCRLIWRESLNGRLEWLQR